MRISELHINEATNENKGQNAYEMWSTNGREYYKFNSNGNLLVRKFFGKYRDFSISDIISGWNNTPLKELNNKISNTLKAMNEQSKSGGCHGMDYSLNTDF